MKLNLNEHFMVDLETLGNGSNAMIVAIGACSLLAPKEGPTFYQVIDPELSDGDIDPSTVKWWMGQSDEARKSLLTQDSVPLREALARFSLFLNHSLVPEENRHIWGNGATFDNVILASAYRRNVIPRPWAFWGDRCYRTLKNLHPDIPLPKRTGTHHNALDDAITQAEHARMILEAKYV